MNKLIKHLILPPKWLRFLLIIILAICVFVRFVNLEQKVYTTDEVRGILRLSGYTSQEFYDRVDDQILTVADLQNYQRPNSEKNLTDAFKTLAGNPEHPPLYYLMARFAIQLFGNPVGARILAVVISFIVFPALYWFCLELLESPLIGWMAIALVAISPFHLMLAQEARQYTLWILATLLSSASLLRALKLKTTGSWIVYSATVILGIYTHLFFALVAFAQGLYVVILERFRPSKTFFSYLLASLASLIAFSPWIWVILSSMSRLKYTTNWVGSYQTSLLNRVAFWLNNLSNVFVDFNFSFDHFGFKNPFSYIILILVAYGTYFFWRNTPQKVWLFLFILIGTVALTQVIPDLMWGGRRSLLSRYLLPCYLGIEIIIAYLLTTQLTSGSLMKRRIWQGITGLLISAGVISCLLASQSLSWWKGSSDIHLQVAPFLNEADNALVVSEANEAYILSISYMLEPDVKFHLFASDLLPRMEAKVNKINVADQDGDVFIYYVRDNLLEKLEKNSDKELETIVGKSRWFSDRTWLVKIVNE